MSSWNATQDPHLEIGRHKLDKGWQKVQDALSLFEQLHLPGQPERLALSGLAELRSAMDWLEDTDEFEIAHKLLDESGRQVRVDFG